MRVGEGTALRRPHGDVLGVEKALLPPPRHLHRGQVGAPQPSQVERPVRRVQLPRDAEDDEKKEHRHVWRHHRPRLRDGGKDELHSVRDDDAQLGGVLGVAILAAVARAAGVVAVQTVTEARASGAGAPRVGRWTHAAAVPAAGAFRVARVGARVVARTVNRAIGGDRGGDGVVAAIARHACVRHLGGTVGAAGLTVRIRIVAQIRRNHGARAGTHAGGRHALHSVRVLRERPAPGARAVHVVVAATTTTDTAAAVFFD